MSSARLGIFAAAALLSWAAPRARAESGIAINASVNKTAVSLDDQVLLTVTISGTSPNLPDPRLPSMPNFNVHSAGRSQSISFSNGAVASTVSHTFILVPRFVGKAAIGAIAAGTGAAQVQTEPIEIAVVRPNALPPGGPGQGQGQAAAPGAGGGGSAPRSGSSDVFVTAEVDNPRPFVNQQVIYTVRFHAAVSLLGNPEWTPPAFNGLLGEDLPPAGHEQPTTIHGRTYVVSEVKMALFPTQPGKLTIGSGSIHCQVQEEMNVDPFAPDFFQRFFSSGQMAAQTRELRTKPVVLEVQALPASGKPAGFSGAVGRFRLKAETDRKEAKVGEAISLSLTVEGSGNLKALGDLPLPELKSLRAYDTVTSLNLAKDGKGVRGSKVYKTVLVAQASGPLKIPPVSLSFFDPERKEYASSQSEAIDLQIAPGDASAPAPSYVAPGGKPSAGITPVSEDIGYMHPRIEESALQRWATAWTGLGWLHLAPLLIFLASLARAGYRERLNQNPGALRFREALPKAQGRVREARGLLAADPQKAAGVLSDALTAFLSAKLDCAAAGLTRREAERLLRARYPKLPEGHLGRLRSLWEELELLRFAPAGQHAVDGHLAEGLLELFKALEEDLR